MAELKRFYVRDMDDWKKTLSLGKFSDKELDIKVVERGIVLPVRPISSITPKYEGGVCDSNFNFVAGFNKTDPELLSGGGVDKGFWTFESAYTVDRKELVDLDEDVIFGGSVNGHFGHFIVECWSRLWFVILHSEIKLKVLFILTDGGYKPWFDEFFKLMGIEKERIVYVKQPMQCRNVIVPEQSQYVIDLKYTKEFFLPYQAIKSRVKPSDKKKLYLTRTAFDASNVVPYRKVFNEKYFEDFFVARGFKAVSLEKLSIEEQISLLMGADEIVALMGTLTHLAMFCKPNVKYIMLNRTERALRYQSFINDVFKIDNYYIVDVSKNFMYARHDNGVFLLGSTKYWKEFVADYFGEHIEEDDDISYLKDSLDNYVNFWCRKYQDPKNLDRWVKSLISICQRIVTLERTAIKNRPLLTYQTHIAGTGWDSWNSEGSLSNSTNQKLDIQAVKIDFPNHKVYYAVYFNESEGWSEEVSNNQQAGTTGKSKPIKGIKIRLDEAGTKEFDIFYRMHKFKGGWTSWAKNGEELLSDDVKLNSIQIELKPKLKTSV